MKITLNQVHDSLLKALVYGWSLIHLYRALFSH